jgi:hypothetical protein
MDAINIFEVENREGKSDVRACGAARRIHPGPQRT